MCEYLLTHHSLYLYPMSTRKTAASGQYRRYGRLIARTAVLCPKATAMWNLSPMPSQRQIRGVGEGVWVWDGVEPQCTWSL